MVDYRLGSTLRPPDGSSEEDLNWMRICLQQQLPTSRFTSVATPLVICVSGFIAIALICLLCLGGPVERQVPKATVTAQKQLVNRLAKEVHATLDEDRRQLVEAAGTYQTNAADTNAAQAAETLVDSLMVDEGPWQGAIVLEATSRQRVSAEGEAVGLDRIPTSLTDVTTIPVIDDQVGPSVLFALTLADGRILAASTSVELRMLQLNGDAEQSVFFAVSGGKTGGAQGTVITSSDGTTEELIDKAVTRVAVGDPASVVGRSTMTTVPSTGQLHRTAPLVVAAVVGETGLAVLSVTRAEVRSGVSIWHGLPDALGLLAASGAVCVVVGLGLVRPVRRLRRLAMDAACGVTPPKRDRPGAPSEVRRIVAAFERLTTRQREPRENARNPRPAAGPAKGRSITISASAIVVVALIAPLAWAGYVVYQHALTPTELPTQIEYDTRNLADGVAISIRESFADGLSVVSILADTLVDTDTSAWEPLMADVVSENSSLRNVYVTDELGTVLTVAGDSPLWENPVPQSDPKVGFSDTSGRVPIIYTTTKITSDRYVFAEFDIHSLITILDRMDGRLCVVDADLRTILDTSGYVAFQKLTDASVGDTARQALGGEPGFGIASVSGSRTLLVSAQISTEGATVPGDLALVVQRSIVSFDLPNNDRRRGAWLVSFLAVTIVLAMLAWYRLTTFGPLRQLASAADKLAQGDTRTVVSAMRHDEIGAIAICMDICRQVVVYGPDRLGGAVRLRGSASDRTAVLQRIEDDDLPQQHRRHTRRALPAGPAVRTGREV